MPQLVRTLNQIMREERKDVYFVRFHNADAPSESACSIRRNGTGSAARKHLLAWLKRNLPSTCTEPIYPEGALGGIDRKLADIRIDFDEGGLARFCAEWERPDGKSIEPHFQCYIEPFDRWRAGISECMPTFERPESIMACLFWDTPKGFLHHAARTTGEERFQCPLVINTANPDNVWFLAGEMEPEWRNVDLAEFVGGCIHYDQEKQNWRVHIGFFSSMSHFERNDQYRLNPENQRRICEWFGLPPERVVFEEYDYF